MAGFFVMPFVGGFRCSSAKLVAIHEVVLMLMELQVSLRHQHEV